MQNQTNSPVIELSEDRPHGGQDPLKVEAKLLAINAAFEAARSGEAGGEFAVLVDLVKEWALRGTQSKEGMG